LKHLAPCPRAEEVDRVAEHAPSDRDPSGSGDKTPTQPLKDAVARSTPTAPPPEARNDGNMPEAFGPETFHRRALIAVCRR